MGSQTYNMSARILSLLLCVGLGSSQLVDDFQCPDEFPGFYPHLISCDKYWYCQEGIAELKTCGNGLGFIDTDSTFTLEQCAELHLVECGERTELEPPISTDKCPRLYGTFADPESCSVFWKCLDGKANRYECPPGLAYDQNDRGCKWADQVEDCKNVVVAVEGEAEEFQCPTRGAVGAFTKHAHPADCRQYFVCIGGVPREYGCPLGTVFSIGSDEFSGKCSDPKEVPECQNYYGDLEFDEFEKAKAGADTGRLPNRVRTGSVGRNPINRENSQLPKRVSQDDVKRRPAPAILQEILDETEAQEEPSRPQTRPRPRPRPSFLRPTTEQRKKPAAESIAPRPTEAATPRPSRLQVQEITDRPRTTFPRTQQPTFQATNRPFTAVFSSEETAKPAVVTTTTTTTTTKAPVRVSPAIPEAAQPSDGGLPDPVPAAPGPNGEDYYYYYYYYDDEEPQQ